MKNIIKYVAACMFSFSFFLTANAQDQKKTPDAPQPGDIICVQVKENVFDCYLKEDLDKLDKGDTNDGKFHEYKPGEDKKDPSLKEDKYKEFESPEDSIRNKMEEPQIDGKEIIQATKQ